MTTYRNRREEVLAGFAKGEVEQKSYKAATQHEAVMLRAQQVVLSPDHPLPRTRRELLSSGLIGGLSYAIMPSLLPIFSGTAFGAECAPSGPAAKQLVPGYLHFEVSGGNAVARHFVPGKQSAGADFVPLAVEGYATIGYGPTQAPPNVTPNTELGGTLHPTSPFLAGLKAVMSPAAFEKTSIALICSESADDTNRNVHNPIQLVTKIAGNPGSLVQIAGNQSSRTGGRSSPLDIGQDPGLSRAVITSEKSLLDLIESNPVNKMFGGDKRGMAEVSKLSLALTNSMLASLSARTMSDRVKDLVRCAYSGTGDMLTKFSAPALQVSTDPVLNTAYNAIPFDSLIKGDQSQQSTMMIAKLMAEGLCTAGTVELGGYDYHGMGLATQDSKDEALGRTVGLALEIAHRKKAGLFISITTDGSVATSANGAVDDRYPGNSDSGVRSGMLMMAIGVNGKPPMNRHQIGKFNDTGAVDTSYLLTSASPPLASLCLAYNYASFIGRLDKFDLVLSAASAKNVFAGSEKSYLAFAS